MVVQPTKAFPGDEGTDEWAGLAADEPDSHGAERLQFARSSAASRIPYTPEARNLGKEKKSRHGADSRVPEYCPAAGETPETGSSASKEQQAAGSEVLPVEDRPLSHWPMPDVDEE